MNFHNIQTVDNTGVLEAAELQKVMTYSETLFSLERQIKRKLPLLCSSLEDMMWVSILRTAQYEWIHCL